MPGRHSHLDSDDDALARKTALDDIAFVER
jgi:hypothetical protein